MKEGDLIRAPKLGPDLVGIGVVLSIRHALIPVYPDVIEFHWLDDSTPRITDRPNCEKISILEVLALQAEPGYRNPGGSE